MGIHSWPKPETYMAPGSPMRSQPDMSDAPAEGGDERVQAASAKHVIVVFISLTERIQTYRKHGEQINHHGDNEPRLLTHKDSSVVSVLGQQFHQS